MGNGYQPPRGGGKPLVSPTTGSGVKPAGAELLPLRAKPAVCRIVLVCTPRMIGGQNVHAAIITRVHSDDVVNVLLIPDGEAPYPIPDVPYSEPPQAGVITWRWPPRT